MQCLLPLTVDPSDNLDSAALAARYAYPTQRPWVRANMVTSLDGAVSVGGRSGGLSGPADKRVFALLRALADVVVVGAGTARTEGYGPVRVRDEYAELRRAAGQPPAPPLAVVSARLDLDASAPLFAAASARTIVITCAAAPPDRHAALTEVADVVVVGDERVDAGRAVDALARRGLGQVLCEGGPVLLGDLMAAGRLDELALTVSPLLVGGAAPRIVHAPLLGSAQPMQLAGALEEAGFLFLRYLRRTEPASG